MTKKIFNTVVEWQNQTFPHATSLSKIKHLAKEIEELWDAIKVGDKEEVRMEYADCFLLLFGSAASEGMTFKDICDAICEKMEINYKREWGNPDENGVVNHVNEKE